MKLIPNSAFVYLRGVLAVTLLGGALAMAFVATTTVPLTNSSATKPRLDKPTSHTDISIAREDFVKPVSMDPDEAGPAPRYDDPTAAAAEDYMHRAYPADELPLSATENAIAAFQEIIRASQPTTTPTPTATPGGKKKKKGKHSALPAISSPSIASSFPWTEVGPSTAFFPNILTFSGASYVTSGRITALAIDPACNVTNCRIWVGAAGGGVWGTTNGLSSSPTWTFLSGFFLSNAIGTLTFDAAHGTLYAGTGEPNASGDSEAGVGIFRSTDGGNTWTQLPSTIGPITTTSPGTGSNGTYTGRAFFGRSIQSIVVDPTNASILYVSSARGVRGISSTTGGTTSNPPTPRPPFGLFKSTDGGNTFSFIWDGGASCPATCNGTDPQASLRGVLDVALDPSNHNIVYAADFGSPSNTGGGVWRSSDAGSTWTQIFAPPVVSDPQRSSFAVTRLGNGNTRMYVGDGNTGASPSQIFRSDLVQTGVPAFMNLTATQVPAGQTSGYCSGQCWYDNVVVTPAGHPDTVYLAGSYSYGTYARSTDGRAVLLSTDAGASFTDMTWDATTNPTPPGQCCNPNSIAPNGLHPDQHALVVNPANQFQFFSGSDGGLVRSSGVNADISGQCTANRGLSGTDLLLCQQLLSRVPTLLTSLNDGLRTLQFQSLSVASDNPFHIQGGTQDNGTFESYGSSFFPQMIYGDGGLSGFSRNNSNLRFNTFTGQANDGNFRNGDPIYWVEITGPILFSVEGALFYPPVISDPSTGAGQTIFQGSRHVWRTQDWGGNQATLEANCPEFGPYSSTCGDFVTTGWPTILCTAINICLNVPGDLGGLTYGTDRRPTTASRSSSFIARTPSNTNVIWASTTGGRVFISDNIDDPTDSNVVWNRIDSNSGAAPGAPAGTSADPTRYPSGIFIDPFNSHHAWITYSGYNFNTPSQPGHVFSVLWDGVAGHVATWTNISFNFPDAPATTVAFDSFTGDLYAGMDFTVLRLPNGSATWVASAPISTVPGSPGLPVVEVTDLKIVPSSRLLYAATHGRGIFVLSLP